ncbi:MAG: glycosyltransferase family 2 protein [Cyanobacteria bacterium P01_D01_bin.44]
MNALAISIFFILIGLVIFQTLPALAFGWSLRSSNLPKPLDDHLPKTAILLSVRGADPVLSDCIRALLAQNYPKFTLKIIVDSYEDPAWQQVNDLIQQLGTTQVQVSLLRLRHDTCSLKGSSLVQAITELDDTYGAVALVDSDVVVYPSWLRELVSPLSDERVGVTTGNRWCPQTNRWGSLVRYHWNAACAVTMYINQVPWGGSMAIKLPVLRQSRLLTTWTQSISIDAPVTQAMRELGLTVKFVPTVMMINREECDLGKCMRWLKRQFLNSWLYMSQRSLVIIETFVPPALLFLAIILSIISLAMGQLGVAIWAFGSVVSYLLATSLIVMFLEQSVQQIVQKRGEVPVRFSILGLIKIVLAIPLTHLVSARMMASAMLTHSVEWRGVTYQIQGPWDIRLSQYRPYTSTDQPAQPNTSIL